VAAHSVRRFVSPGDQLRSPRRASCDSLERRPPGLRPPRASASERGEKGVSDAPLLAFSMNTGFAFAELLVLTPSTV